MYVYTTNVEFEHVFNVKNLDQYREYSNNAIGRLEDMIEREKEYQAKIEAHKEKVLSTPTEQLVILERYKDWHSNKITYNVSLEERPVLDDYRINGQPVIGRFTNHKSFEGRDRHQAFKYAKELAEKFEVSIEKKGMKS